MKSVAVFDIESTGVDVETARIVTAFFGVLDAEGNVIEAHNWMVRPDGYEIPEEATAVHGVSTEQALAEGADEYGALRQIYVAIITKCVDENIPVTGHNLAYDFTVLDRNIQRHEPGSNGAGVEDFFQQGLVVLDSLVIDKHIDPYRKGKRTLITAAEHYGVELSEEEAHGAQADAIASGRIIQAMLRQGLADEYGPKALHEAQKEWKREQAASLEKYFRTKADPIQPDAVVNGDWPYIPRGAAE